ncbi:MAG: circularly permuted type 2 ATP-grasp protein [Hyphomicrobiaceae bacterium]|nr:circularly permuted type 2 ATP-grasp protein [Hyphomicrobiaceae bacterium]MCC0010291.1 circularly permuted type 2 ATP-grasp protein [Hyphomicrobiaceae bacterium]
MNDNTTNMVSAVMPPGSDWISRYRGSAFDELIGPDGRVRPHWQPVVSFLENLGPERAAALSERIQRRIVENGITLDSFSDPNQVERPWKLDLVPLVLDQREWQPLERALIQRARLYEALLSDLYGRQDVLNSGLLPPALVFDDPSFLRAVHGIGSHDPRLMFLALDLARDTNGTWHILDTHAETLAGHGYALANRVVHADVCGRMFRECNALRISGFYQDVAQELARRSGQDAPSIAILGPNPDHETYLNHAYMARYMGYQLLEGSDLRVVDGKAYHKTLAGLQPVDLLVRAVEAAKADPLELRPDGFDGPAGLVMAVRNNPSLVANALGTAIVENRGIGPCLNRLSQYLLGEDPILQDTPRLWLGDPAAREEVLSQQSEFLLRPAFEATARPGHAQAGRCLSDMAPEERDRLIAEISLNGPKWVAEQAFQVATSPSFDGTDLVAKPYAVRCFVASTENGYAVLPGGLALTVQAGAAVALTADSGESRDVWIATSEPQGPHYSRWRMAEEEVQVQRLGIRLPSRVADNLYWLGRYVERADWTMRVMRNSLSRGDEDLRPIRRADVARSALDVIVNKARTNEGVIPVRPGADSLEQKVEELFSSAVNPYGILVTFQNIRKVARQSRDRLSLDAWRLLSALSTKRPNAVNMSGDPAMELVDWLDQLIAELAAFNGLMHENMTRNFGWRFMDLGRRTERALQMAELLNTVLVNVVDESEMTEHLAFLLETADCFITYRARYRFAPTFPLVLDLLMVDETNPRGISFQLVEILDHIGELPKASLDAVRTPEQRLALDLLTQVRLADIDALRQVGTDGRRTNLVQALGRLITGLPQLSDIISRRYFSLTEEQPHRVHTRLAH